MYYTKQELVNRNTWHAFCRLTGLSVDDYSPKAVFHLSQHERDQLGLSRECTPPVQIGHVQIRIGFCDSLNTEVVGSWKESSHRSLIDTFRKLLNDPQNQFNLLEDEKTAFKQAVLALKPLIDELNT